MNIPAELKYTKEHEWVRVEGNTATIGITAFAQGEMGDIVYVEVDTLDEEVAQDQVFGTVEAVKTVSDLFSPLSVTVTELNPDLADNPELVNTDPYGAGWMIKLDIKNAGELDGLMDAAAYAALIGA